MQPWYDLISSPESSKTLTAKVENEILLVEATILQLS